MGRKKLIEYVKHPAMLANISEQELREWIEEFPYSQNLRLLLAKKIRQKSDSDKDESIIDAAMYSTDRSKLYESLREKPDRTGSSGITDDVLSEVGDQSADKGKELSISEGLPDSADREKELSVSEGLPDSADREKELSVSEGLPDSVDREKELSVSEGLPDSADREKELSVSEGLSDSVAPESNLLVGSAGLLGDTEMKNESIVKENGEPVNDSSDLPDMGTVSQEGFEDLHVKEDPDVEKLVSHEDYSATKDIPLPKELDPELNISGLSEFSRWLMTLPQVHTNITEVTGEVDSQLIEKEAVSASLAELLTAQGHYEQAIAMYEKLQLKFPEKSGYFAAQIQKLKAI